MVSKRPSPEKFKKGIHKKLKGVDACTPTTRSSVQKWTGHLVEGDESSHKSGTEEARRSNKAIGSGSGDGGRSRLRRRATAGDGRGVLRVLGHVGARNVELGGAGDGSSRASLGGGVASRVEGRLHTGDLLGAGARGGSGSGGVDNGDLDRGGGRGDVDRGRSLNLGRSGLGLRSSLNLSSRSLNQNLGRGGGAVRAVGHSRVALGESEDLGGGRGQGGGRRQAVVLGSRERSASGDDGEDGEAHFDVLVKSTVSALLMCLKKTVLTRSKVESDSCLLR